MTAKSAHPEKQTQDRLIKFFENELKCTYLGNNDAYPVIELGEIILSK